MSKPYWPLLSALTDARPWTLSVWQSSASVEAFRTSPQWSAVPVRVEWTASHRRSRSLQMMDLSPYVSATVPAGESFMPVAIHLRTLLRNWKLRLPEGNRGGGRQINGSVSGALWRKSLEPYSRMVSFLTPGLSLRFPFHEVPRSRPGYVRSFQPPSEPRATQQTIGRELGWLVVRDCYRVRRAMCQPGCRPEGCTCDGPKRFDVLSQVLKMFL